MAVVNERGSTVKTMKRYIETTKTNREGRRIKVRLYLCSDGVYRKLGARNRNLSSAW